MVGVVIVIGCDDVKICLVNSKLCEVEQDFGWINNDDSQLLVYMFSYVQDDEFKFIDEVIRNVVFVDVFCF